MKTKWMMWSCLAVMFASMWAMWSLMSNWYIGLLSTCIFFGIQYWYDRALHKVKVEDETSEV